MQKDQKIDDQHCPKFHEFQIVYLNTGPGIMRILRLKAHLLGNTQNKPYVLSLS